MNTINSNTQDRSKTQESSYKRESSDTHEPQSVSSSANAITLEEYLSRAALPTYEGVPGQVVKLLCSRIGVNPIGIYAIAQILGLSKRTLQRRCDDHGLSFSQLRDQVRYHFAVDYLIFHKFSVEEISIKLDFSDRTAFCNAFKRWSNLSPSVFRKRYRELADSIDNKAAKTDMTIDEQIEAVENCESDDFNRLLSAAGLPANVKLNSVELADVDIKSALPIEADFSSTNVGSNVRVNGVDVESVEALNYEAGKSII